MAGHLIPSPTSDQRPIDWLLQPFQQLSRHAAFSGILLLACTLIALVWANSAWRQSYHDFWHTDIAVQIGTLSLGKSLAHWVNDGLMAVFFFVVGLEIKRELLVGDLASVRQAAVPIAGAIGGMALPAVAYVIAIAVSGGEGMKGWAIPAATDIAFALGVMAILGRRVTVTLKIFLTAVAIVDDIGAVLIIALFYSSDLSLLALGFAGFALILLITANLLHIRRPIVYGILGILLWLAFLQSGVHATIAGVILAFTIPSRFRIRGAEFTSFSQEMIDDFRKLGGNQDDIMTNPQRQASVYALERACEYVQTPLQRLEHKLHPFVAWFVMPVFALANAGVELGEGLLAALLSPIALGVISGLFLGKQVGVWLATWIAVKMGIGALPEGITWRQIYAAGCLAGIGFTMSMFIAGLAFGEGPALAQAKIGILAGSLMSGVLGCVLLHAATAGTQGER